MAERIGLWSVGEEGQRIVARPLEEARTTETERRLEDLLVGSPEVLMPGLTLIGRQVVTAGGPLDLIGIDSEGQLVLFELKRGTLTRDAVAQILDYASDLADQDPNDFAALVQESSGRHGIQTISDFADWYKSEFPAVEDPPPAALRLVLVGLGVDDRALRMVNFLAGAGVDIQLLTFQAFRHASGTFLARHLETVEPRGGRAAPSGGTKDENRRVLEQLAHSHGVQELIKEVADYVQSVVPAYRWPGKTAFTFSLQELSENGNPSLRAYVSVGVDQREHGRVLVSFTPRALDAAGHQVESLIGELGGVRTELANAPMQLPVTEAEWPVIREPLQRVLRTVVDGWKRKVEEREPTEDEPESPAAQV